MIHIIHNFVICGAIPADLPKEKWPEGETAVEPAQRDQATCPDCIRIANEYLTQHPAP